MTRLTVTIALIAGMFLSSVAVAASDVSGKVVLANLDRYDAVLRIGSVRREIQPKKASVLAPKRYPITFEYWSGNTKAGWRKQSIANAGVYGFNFKNGNWMLNELKKPAARPATQPAAVKPSTTVARRYPASQPTSRVIRQRIVTQPVRRLPINADPNRWSPLARAAYAAGKIYQFVRDEQDRDLLRHLLIRAREDEDWDRLEDWLRDAKIPELYKHDLRDAFEDLGRLSDADWKEIDTSDEKDWDQARADLGDLISDAEWDNVAGDFAEIDTSDYWQDNVDLDLGGLDYADNLDFQDVDLSDLDADYGFDVGGVDMAEDLDIDDIGIDSGSYDLGGFDDFGGYDGASDVDTNDFGGGYFGDDDFGDFGGFDDFDF
jgi:hypothetical protein